MSNEKPSSYTPEECREMLNDKLDKKVSTRAVIATIAIVSTIVIAIMGMTYSAYSNAQEKQDNAIEHNTEMAQESIKDRAIQKVKLEAIQTSVDEVKQAQKEQSQMTQKIFTIMQEIRNDKDELQRDIKSLEDKIEDFHHNNN